MDFLKTHPSFTMYDYMWGLSAPKIKLMMADATEVLHLTEKQQQQYKNWKRSSRSVNRVYTDSEEDMEAFERELGI